MATVTKPIALDESLNTTEVTPRNIADVLADELSNIASKIQGSGSSVSWNQLQVTGDKIAEITISGVKTDVMSHSIAVSRIQTTGTHIANITIDGVKTELYAPQGSPSFNALIIVTAETGKTVTATKGGDTYTATEVSTGTYEVSVDSAGTWTISDGTLSDTVSVVSQTTYYVTLSSVPDGKTVTPTDDVSIWLKCGQRSENYTTLSQVLADSTCLSALMADNNAVDYLVRSTTWAGDSSIKIPNMTSNTAPSGTCSASSSYSGTYPYYAFDGNNTTRWISNVGGVGSGDYIGYDFGTTKKINKIDIDFRCSNDAETTENYKITTNNGGTVLKDNLSVTMTSTSAHYPISIEFDEPVNISDFRIEKVSSSQSSRLCVWGIQVSLDGITLNSTAMSYIGLNNYCANTLLSNSTWCEAICNSTYFESVLNIKVPTMTSNTTPSGVCSGSSKYTGRDYYQAFDGSSATYWYATDSNIPAYIQYQFTSAVKVKYVVFDVSGGNDPSQARVKDYDIKADGVVVYSGTHQTTSITEKAYLYNNETSATTWQVYVKNMWGGARIGLNQLQFYGREDV